MLSCGELKDTINRQNGLAALTLLFHLGTETLKRATQTVEV